MRRHRRRKPGKGAPEQSEQSFFPAVQKKLSIGKADDAFEKEADSVADRVVTKGESGGAIQKMGAADEEVQEKPISDSISSIQKKDMPVEEEPVQKQEKEEEPVQKQEEEEAVQQQEEEEEAVQQQEEEETVQQQEEEETVQQQEEEETVQQQEEEETVQQQEEEEAIQQQEEEETVQQKSNPTAPTLAPTSNIESRLKQSRGGGSPMSSSVKSEMEHGFGTSFNDVNIHTDAQAENMSSDIGAQAFTHGKDIYFNKGKYDPNSVQGKILLAHELTHTIQQEGAEKQDDSKANNLELEKDSDTSTKGFLARLLGGGKEDKSVMPKKKSGIRIASCGLFGPSDREREREKAEELQKSARDLLLEEFKKKREAGDASIPAVRSDIKEEAVKLGKDAKIMESYQKFQDGELDDADLKWGFFFSKDKSLKGAAKKPGSFDSWSDFDGFSSKQKSTLFQISRITGLVKHNAYSKNKTVLAKLKKAYDYWPKDQYAIHQSGSTEANNTCNVFVGNSLFNAGYTGNNGGKLWSAAEIYEGAGGLYEHIDNAYTMPGDIVAYGGHVGVVVKVDVENEKFITREGYIEPKGSERERSFDELLGLDKPELKVMRKK